MERSIRKLIPLVFLLIAVACNPFAPAIEDTTEGAANLITDQTTIDGLFQNFRYAYTFKDTTIYGGLLAHDFTFTYRDYERRVDENWGRDEEMRITWHLFQNASSLNLIWNNIVGFSGDSLLSSVTRSFNLTVTFNPNDVVRVDGRVSLDLERPSAADKWKITQWRDESNY
ncbi:MAG: hypothetical protein C0600_11900 [Ignavibacteria bacterium]|nr:MAG: hypothetical protein C0600_11900 [Ignavibacteria bacterium]